MSKTLQFRYNIHLLEKSEGVMPKKKNGQTRRQRKKQQRKELAKQPEALDLADNPMADVEAEEFYSFDDFVKENDIPDDELLEIVSDELGEDIEDIEEAEEKCVSEAIVINRPTDFEELDAEREAREQAHKISNTAYDAERLLTNIVYDPILEPDEKEDKIKRVGSDFAKRLTNIVQDKKEVEEEWEPSEKELDKAEAEMWASFLDVGILEKLLTKAKLTTAKGRAEMQATAKKMGFGKASKDNLNGILVEKDTKGVYRWTGFVSNNFKDREDEIISEAAHKEFVSYLDANPDRAPEFWTWHTKGTARASKVDAWLYHEGFLIMSGPLTDIEAYRLMKAISLKEMGMSHGFIGMRDPDDPSVIVKYRAYEVSDLPLSKAANVWTSIETQLKEVSSMSKEQIEHLELLMGEEYVANLLENAEENKDILEAAGIGSKEVDEPEAETEQVKEGKELTKKQKKVVEEVFEQEASEVKEFMDTAKKMMPLMAQKILDLEEKLDKTEEEAEDTLADMIGNTAASKAKALSKRPSENEENITDEKLDEPRLKEHDPDDWWGVKIEREEEEA
jgi:hypothetical protein